MFSIGEFSKACGLTVKTLRFYHEQQLLVPRSIDESSGYRYYDADQIDVARTIAYLRKLDFSLEDIKHLLERQEAGEPIVDTLERHRAQLDDRIKHLRNAVRSLERFIADERQALTLSQTEQRVEQKELKPTLIAGIRMIGHYSDCGQAFARIGRSLGRHICGKPLLLHFDDEYKEADASFEACMPIRRAKKVDGIEIRELEGGPALTLLHHGPYEELGRSYAAILKHAKQQQQSIALPTREVYLKGPGMIFRGNPRSYLTEIQLPLS